MILETIAKGLIKIQYLVFSHLEYSPETQILVLKVMLSSVHDELSRVCCIFGIGKDGGCREFVFYVVNF
jgi:hypothetical protein